METTAATKGTKGQYRRDRVGWWEGATRNEVIVANMGLVYVIAGQWRKRMGSLTIDDLLQEGSIGLGEAFDRYDASRCQFSTYATWWIRQKILAAIADQSMTIKTPASVQAFIRKKKRGEQLTSHEEVLVDFADVAAKVERLGRSVINDEKFSRPMEPYVKKVEYVSSDVIDSIMIAVDKLNPLQKEVILARFGIGCERQTLKQVSGRLGFTKEWARQQEMKAIARLRILSGLKDEDAA